MAIGRPIKLTPNVARKTITVTATANQTDTSNTNNDSPCLRDEKEVESANHATVRDGHYSYFMDLATDAV